MSKSAGGKEGFSSSSPSPSAHYAFGSKATKAMSRAELEAFFLQHGGSRAGDSLGATEGSTPATAGAKTTYVMPSLSTNIPSNYSTATSPYAPKRDGDGEFSRKLLEATRKKLVINSPEEEREQKEKEEYGIAIIHNDNKNNNKNALKNSKKSGETKMGGPDNVKKTQEAASRWRDGASLTTNNHHAHDLDDEIEDFLFSKARDEAYENPSVVSPSGTIPKEPLGEEGGNAKKADGADEDMYEPYANLNDAPSAPFLFGAPRRLKTNNGNQQESNINTLLSDVHSNEDKNVVHGGGRGLQFTHYTYDGTPRSQEDAQQGDSNAHALVDVPSRTTELIQQAKAIAARANGGVSGAFGGTGREYPFAFSSHPSRTVHSTEADREAHEEQLYLSYVKLQEQQDEIDAYRRKLGWDQLQGNFMGIKTVLDSGNEAIDREGEQSLGDWDTYNRVQETLKTFVFRRAPEASREEGPDFVAMLKTRLHRSRETIDALKKSVNDLSDALKASSREAKAAQQLAKEQGAELQRLKSLNTSLSVQMRHMRTHSQHRITAIAGGGSSNNTNNTNGESFALSPNGAGSGSGGSLAEQLASLRNDYMELSNVYWKSENDNRLLRMKISGGDGEGGEIPQMIGGDIGVLIGKGIGEDGKGQGGVSSVINNGSLFARSQNKGNDAAGAGGNGPAEKQAYSRSRFVTAQMQAHTRAVVALSSGRRAWRRRLEAAERDKMSALDTDAGGPLVPASGRPSSTSLSSPNTNGTGGSLALALQKTNMRMIELAKAHLGEKERKQREENTKKHSSIAMADGSFLLGGNFSTASCGTSPMAGGLILPDVDGNDPSKGQQPPHTYTSNTTTTPRSGWRILHEKILGNFALSRAEVLRREELHVRRLRHKIALLSEELAMAAADRDLIADYYQRSEQEVDELHAALTQAKAKTERLEEQIHEWGDQRQHIATVAVGGSKGSHQDEEVRRGDPTSFASTLLAGLDLDSLTEEERQKIMINADADAISSAAQLHALANIFNTRMGTYERQLKAKDAEVERLLRETHQLSTMQHQGMSMSMAESGSTTSGGVVISTTNAAVLSEEVRRLEKDALKKERTLIAYEQEIKRLRAIVLAAQDEVIEERAAVRLGISMPTAARVVSTLRARARKAVLRVKQRNAQALRAIQVQEEQEERARQRELQGADYEDDEHDRNGDNEAKSRSDTMAQMSSPLSESLKAEKEIAIQLLLLARRDDHRDLVQSLLDSVKEDEVAEERSNNKKDNGSSYTTGYSSSQQHQGRNAAVHYSSYASSSRPAPDETTWCSSRRLWLRLIGSREEQWRSAPTLEERLMAEKRLSDAYAFFMLFEQLGDSRAHPAVACAAALRVISQAAAPIALLESGGIGGGGNTLVTPSPNNDDGVRNATGLASTRRKSHEGSSNDTETEDERDGDRERDDYRVFANSTIESTAMAVKSSSSDQTNPQSTTRAPSGDGQVVVSKKKRLSDQAGAKDGSGKHTINPKTKNKTNEAKRIKHKNLTIVDADLNGDAAAASRRNAIEVEREYRALVDLVKGRTAQLSALAERREELADQLRAFGGGAADATYANANGGVEVSTEEEQSQGSSHRGFRDSVVAASSQSSLDKKQGLIGGGYSPSSGQTKKRSKKGDRSNAEKSVVIPSSPHVLYYRYRTRGADETVAQAAARFGITDLAVILATAMTFIPDTVQALMARGSDELPTVKGFSKSGPFYVPLLTLAQLEAAVRSGVGRGLLKRDKDGDRYSADAGVDKSMVGVMRVSSETVASSPLSVSPALTTGAADDEFFFVLRRRVRASDTLASIAADVGVPVESIVYVGTTTLIDHETRRLQQKMGFDAQNPLTSASSSSPLPSSQIINHHQISGSASMSHSGHRDEDEKVRMTALRSGTPPPTNTTGTDPTAVDGSVVPLSSPSFGFVDVINDRRFAQVVDVRIPTASAFAMLAARATGGAASGLNSGNTNAGSTTAFSTAVGAEVGVAAVRDEDLLLIAYTALSRLQDGRREGADGSPSTMSLETIATVHNVPLSSLIALNVSPPKTIGAPLWFPAVLSVDNAHIIASALGAAFFAKERETARLLEQERLYAMSASLGGFVMPSRGVFNGIGGANSTTAGQTESDAAPISEALAWERDNERHLSASGPQIEALDGLVLVHNGLIPPSSSVSSSPSTPTTRFGEPSVAPPSLLRALYGIAEDYLTKHTITTSMDGDPRWPVARENSLSKSASPNPKTKDPSADRIGTSKRRSAAESSSSSVYEEIAAELSVLVSGGHAAAVPLKDLDPFEALLSTAATVTDTTSGLLSSLRGSASSLYAPIASNFAFATRGRVDGGNAYAESSGPVCGAYSMDASDSYAPLSGALKMTWCSGLYDDSKLSVASRGPEQRVAQQHQVLMRVRGLPALSRHAPLDSLPLKLTSKVEKELKKASTALIQLNRTMDCAGFGAQQSEGARAAPASSGIRQPQKKIGSAAIPTAAPLASARVGPIEFALSERCSVLTIAMASGTLRECLSIPHVSSLSPQNAQRVVTTWLIKIEDVRQIRACQRTGALTAAAGSRSTPAGSVSPLITLHALLHIHNVSLAALSSRFSLPTSTLLQHNPELTSGGNNSTNTNVFLDPQVGLTGYIRVPIRTNAMIGRALSGALSGSSDLLGSIPYSLGTDEMMIKPPIEGAVLFSGLYATAPYSVATMGSALAVATSVGVSLGAISIFEGMLDPSVLPTPAVVVRPLLPHSPMYWNLSSQVGGSAECLLTVTWQHEEITNVLYRGGRGQDRDTAEVPAGEETAATFVARSRGTIPAAEQTVLAIDADFNNGKLRSAIERDVMSILQFLGIGGGNGSGTSAHIKYVSTAGVVTLASPGEEGAKEPSGGEYLVLHILCSSYVMALAAKAHLNATGRTCAMPHTKHALSMMGVEVETDKTSSDSNPDKHMLTLGAVPLSAMSLTPLPCSQESCEIIPIVSQHSSPVSGRSADRSSAEEADPPVDKNTTLLDLCLRYKVSADVFLALNPLLAFGLMRSACPAADNDPAILKAVRSLSVLTGLEIGHSIKDVSDHDTLAALCQRKTLLSNTASAEPSVTVSTQLLRLKSALLLPIGCFVQTLRVPPRPSPQEAHLASLSSPHLALLCPLFSSTSSSSATLGYRLAQCGGSSSRSLLSIASSAQCAVHQLTVSPNALTARPGACLKLPQRPSTVRSDGQVLPMIVDREELMNSSDSVKEWRRERLVGIGESLSEIAEEAGLAVWELALLNSSTVSVARGALVMVPAPSRSGLHAAAAMLPALPFALESLQGTAPDSSAFTPHRGFVVRHAVQPHETILSICGRYNQGLPSVLRANPSLFAMSGAVVLLVPVNEPSRREALLRAKAQNLFTVVIPSIYDTAANLSRRFDVSLSALADANKLVLTTSLTAASGGGIDNVSGGSPPQPTAEMTEAELLAQQRIFVPVISELGRSLTQQRNLSLYVAVGLRPSETVVTVADRYSVFAKDVMVLGRKLLNIGAKHISVPVAPATATRLAGELSRFPPASASPSYSIFFNFDVRPQESMLDVMNLFGGGSAVDLSTQPPPSAGGAPSTSKAPRSPSYVVCVDALHQGSTYSVATEVAGVVSSAASFTSALPAAALTESASYLATAKLLSTGVSSSHIVGEDIKILKFIQPTLLSVPITSTEAAAKALLRERSAEMERTSLSRRVAALSHAIRSLAGRNEATQRELKAVAEVRAALLEAEGVRGERAAAAREVLGLLPAIPRSKTVRAPTSSSSTCWLSLPTYAFNAISSGTQTAPVTIAGKGYVSPIRVPAAISEAQTDLTSDVIALIQNEAKRADDRVRDAQETVGRYKNEFDKLNQHKVEIEEEVLGLQRSLLTQRRLDAEANGELKVTIEDLRKRLAEATGTPYVPPTPSEANASINEEHQEESSQQHSRATRNTNDSFLSEKSLRKDREEGDEEGGVQRFTSETSRSFRRTVAPVKGGGEDIVPTESAFAAQQRQQQQRPLPAEQQPLSSSSTKGLQEGGGSLTVSGLPISSPEEGPRGPMTRSVGVYADRLTLQERLDSIGFGGMISSSSASSRGAALRNGHGQQGKEGTGRLSPTPPSSSMPRGGLAAEGPMISTTAGSFRKGGMGGGGLGSASMSSPPMSSLVLASEARNGSNALVGGTVIVEDLEREGDLVPAMVMSKTKAKCLQSIAVRLDGTTNRLRADLAQLKRSLQASVNELNTKTRVLLMPLLGPNITQQDIDRKVSEMEASRREEIDSRIAEGVRVITSLLAPQMAQLFDSLKKRRAINLAPYVNHSKLFTTTDEKNLTNEDWVEKRLAQYVSDSLRSFDYNVAGNTQLSTSGAAIATAGNNAAGDGRTYAFPPAAFSTPASGRLSPSRFARLANRIEASAAQSGGILADSLDLSGRPNKEGGSASSHNGALLSNTAGPKPDTHDWAVDTNDLLPPGLLPPLKASMVSGGGSALDSLKASTMAAMRQALAEMEAEEESKRLSAMVPKGVNFIDVRQSPLGPSPREITMQLAQQRTRGGGSNKAGAFLGFASTLPNLSSKLDHSVTPSGKNRYKDKGSEGSELSNSTGGDGPDGARPSSTPAGVGVVHRPDGTSTSVRANQSQRIPAPPAAKKGASSSWFDASEDPTGSSTPMSPKQNRPRPRFQSSAANDTNFSPKSPSSAPLAGGLGMVVPLSPTALKKLEAITPNKRSQAVLSRVFSDAQRQLLEAIFGEGSGMMSTSPSPSSTSLAQHSHLMAAMMSDPSTSSQGGDLLAGNVGLGVGVGVDRRGRGMSLSLKGDGIGVSHASLGFSSPNAAAHDHFVLERAHHGVSVATKQGGGPHQPPTLSPNSQILGLNEDEHKATIAMRSLMMNPDLEAYDTPLGGGGGPHSSFPLSFKQAASSSASLYPFPYAMRSASMSTSTTGPNGGAALPPALGRLRAAQLTDGERAVVATLRSADAQLQREQAQLLMRRVGTSIRVRQLIKRLEALPSTSTKSGPSPPSSPSSSVPPRPTAVASGLVQLWQGWLRGWLTRRTRAAHQQKKNIAALAALFAGEGLANTTASSTSGETTNEAEAFLQSHAPHVAVSGNLAEGRRKSENGSKRDLDEPSSPMNVANAIDLLQRRKVLRELEEAMAEGGEAGAATAARILTQHEHMLFGGSATGLKRGDLRSGFVGLAHPSLFFGEKGTPYSLGIRPLVPPAPAAARQPSSSHFRDVLLPSESSTGAEGAKKRDVSPSKQ